MIVAALTEWSRKAELSADRAGLLATQDPAVAFRVHMKLACGSGDLSELDQTAFFAQGTEYIEADDIRDSVLKLMLVEGRSTRTPSSVRPSCAAGSTPARTPRSSVATTPAARTTTTRRSRMRPRTRRTRYSEAFRSSQDALGKLVHDVAGMAGSAKVWLDEQLRRDRD